MHRDSVLAEHGYNTIRIKNMDTKVNVVFWQRLLEGLDNIYSSERSEAICKMKKELESMIAEEIRKWTMLE
jgi:hypothetical protein